MPFSRWAMMFISNAPLPLWLMLGFTYSHLYMKTAISGPLESSPLPCCHFLPGGVVTLHSQVCYVVVHPESLSKFFLKIYLKRLVLTSFSFAHILNLYHLHSRESVKVKWLCSQVSWIQIQSSCMTSGEVFVCLVGWVFLASVSLLLNRVLSDGSSSGGSLG